MPKEPIRPNIGNIKPYISGKPIEEAERELRISGVIKLASNENPLGPSPKALEAVNKYSKDISLYPDQNCYELNRLLAEKLGMPPGNIAIGNGSDELMLLIALAYISAGDEAIISLNTFSTYEMVCRLMEASITRINLKNYTYNLEEMAKVAGPKTKLIFICNPNNPTGTMNTKKEMDDLVSKVPQNTIIVIDEAYGEYVASPDYPDSVEYVKNKKNVVVLRTFSKIYGLAGLRVGYAIARPEIIKYLNLVRMPFSVNRLAQIAAAVSLSDTGHVEKSIKNNSEGKVYLYAELEKLGVSFVKTEANFIFINLNSDADMAFMGLMRRGVIVRPLTSFGMPGSIRVTIGTPEQNKKFINALSQVVKP
ncbi:MAG: histidinol-phosphate transaminase [bacterium]